MRVRDLVDALEHIAPSRYAESWDNVGLLLGDPEAALGGPVALTTDLSVESVEEAVGAGCGAMVVYHPPIFTPLSRITPDSPHGRALLRAIGCGLALLSPHTAIDAAPDGIADWLCEKLAPQSNDGQSFGDRRAIEAAVNADPNQTHKIVTFVPADHVNQIRDALASVGAGRIGLYQRCSFNSEGVGTFLGAEHSNPNVGEAGQLESVREIRMEMVCREDALALIGDVLRQFHPYEEPAWDIYKLTAKPNRSIGAGRRVTLDQPATPTALADRLRQSLGVDAVKLAKVNDKPVTRIGVCPGAGASLLSTAIADGCTLFVTGEMRHHEALDAIERGCSVLLAGHTNTERGYLPILAERINALCPDANAFHCTTDGSLFRTLQTGA